VFFPEANPVLCHKERRQAKVQELAKEVIRGKIRCKRISPAATPVAFFMFVSPFKRVLARMTPNPEGVIEVLRKHLLFNKFVLTAGLI
jgi:hypothetical protein